MKKYLLIAIMFFSGSLFANTQSFTGCPSIKELKQATFKICEEKQPHVYDLVGATVTPPTIWLLHGYSIPGKNASEAIKKANSALRQGQISAPRAPRCNGNSCTCDYKLSVNLSEYNLTTFIMF